MRSLLLALLLLLLATAAHAEEKYFTDGTGTKIAYGQDCQRIVSLMPNLTEMVAFLGYSKQLVGKSSFCNYPDSILGADDVGGQIDASIEKIVALQPDIVLAYQGNSLELVDQLRQLGIQVCALKEANTVGEIAGQMRTVNKVLGKAGTDACPNADEWQQELENSLSTAGGKLGTVFFGYPGELVYTAGTESFINDVMQKCRLHNAVDIPDRWPSVSAEYILACDPDWILTTTSCTEEEDPADARDEMLKELRKDPVFRELRAVKEGQLIVVNADHLLRPGPRILEGIKEIRAQISKSEPVAAQR